MFVTPLDKAPVETRGTGDVVPTHAKAESRRHGAFRSWGYKQNYMLKNQSNLAMTIFVDIAIAIFAKHLMCLSMFPSSSS